MTNDKNTQIKRKPLMPGDQVYFQSPVKKHVKPTIYYGRIDRILYNQKMAILNMDGGAGLCITPLNNLHHTPHLGAENKHL